jgi:hypothetical protein
MRVVKAAAVSLVPVLYSSEGTVEKIVRKIHELGQQGVRRLDDRALSDWGNGTSLLGLAQSPQELPRNIRNARNFHGVLASNSMERF